MTPSSVQGNIRSKGELLHASTLLHLLHTTANLSAESPPYHRTMHRPEDTLAQRARSQRAAKAAEQKAKDEAFKAAIEVSSKGCRGAWCCQRVHAYRCACGRCCVNGVWEGGRAHMPATHSTYCAGSGCRPQSCTQLTNMNPHTHTGVYVYEELHVHTHIHAQIHTHPLSLRESAWLKR